MKRCSLLIAIFLCGSFAALAQAPPAPPPEGLRPPWEARKVFEGLQGPVEHLRAALSRVQTQRWQGAGASNYAAILQSAEKEVGGIQQALSLASQQPDHASLTIRLVIALYQFGQPIDTLAKGAEQYHDYATARELQDAVNKVINQREAVVNYVVELSEFNEHNRDVASRDLESCRKQLLQCPAQLPRPHRR